MTRGSASAPRSTTPVATGVRHFLLTATGSSKIAGGLYVVHAEGSIHDAMRVLREATGRATSHGRSCSCVMPTDHRGTVVRDGEVIR